MFSWGVGLVATALCLVLGTQYLGWSVGSVLLSVLTANIAGFLGLLSTLTLERQTWARRTLMKGSWGTWTVFWVLCLGCFFAITPQMRNWTAIQYLILPLIAANGWMIPVFGVVQDALVARRQIKERAQQSGSHEPSRLGSFIPLFARAAWNAISFKSSN